jgi:hypothetical protein
MERSARSRSLANLTDSAAGRARASGTAHASGTATAHLSLLDLSGTGHLAEESLLDAGSPAGSPGCSTECDPSLLDFDSDNPGIETEDGQNTDGDNMLVDNVMPDQLTSIIDPLYHQCKIARRMSFVDRLVSVTNDGTFGSIVSCAWTAGGDSGPSPAPAPPPCLIASTYIWLAKRKRRTWGFSPNPCLMS